jgi:hypothetical protein
MPDLGKQIGPLPLGAWIAVVGGSLGFMFYSRNRQNNSGPVEVAAGPDFGVGLGGIGAVGAYTPTDGGVSAPSSATAAIQSNNEWGRAVFNWLVGNGSDGSTVDTAVRAYLSGRTLTTQQNALITQGLAKFGQAPEILPAVDQPPAGSQYAPGFYGRAGGTGIYQLDENGNLDWLDMPEYLALGAPQNVTQITRDNPFWTNTHLVGEDFGSWAAPITPAPVTVSPPAGNNSPSPAPAPAPAPPPGRTYTVQPGDSLSRIAARYWEPWITWQSIYNANRGVIGGNPGLIRPGQVLVIA